MATMLHNRLVDACVVVGMDEQTGLLPLPKMSSGSDYGDVNVSNVLGPFQINVLGVFTGTMAFFPCHHTERISGEPFYPETSVICPMASDVTTGTQRKIRRSMSFAPTAMPFSSEVVHSLPPFFFPDGGFVNHQTTKPYMHYVVLTNLDGGRTYGCGLIITRKFGVVEKDQLSGGYELGLDVEDDYRDHLFVPFCVCLISKSPYFNTMKDMLSSLLITLETSRDPWPIIMKFASNVASILVPPPGDLSIEIKLFGNNVIVPSAGELDGSVMDLDLHLPLLMLSVDDILKVIACILAEQRLIFICSSQALIPLVIECFFTFVEPFKWRRTYVPILPHKLADLIEAPGPFIMGCHSRLRSHIKQVIRMEEIPSIVVVDLDKGSVEVSPNEKIEQLPNYVTQALVVRLRLSKFHYDLELMKTPTFYDVMEAKRHRENFIHEFRKSIKAACLDLMVSLFADVLIFMRVGERLFDKDGYIQSKFDEDQGFFEEVCASDAFDRFVDDRLENPSKRDTFAVLAEQVNVSSNSMTRKRSTSNMTRVAHRTSSSYRLAVNNPKAVFKQPPLLDEGLHTGEYYKSCIDKLTEEIESRKNKNIALKASYLYLRGMLYIASNQSIRGLDDFHALYSANQELFPTDYVKDVIANLDERTEVLLEQQEFYKRAAIFRIFKKKTEEQTTGRPIRKLPHSPLEHSEFEKRVKALQIAISDETAERLFATLTHQRDANTITPEQFVLFYNTFMKMEREIELVDLPGVTLEDDENRVLCSPLINTTRGMGRLIVTTHQLFFVGDGLRESFLISRLRDIKEIIRYQHYVVFPPGVPALRIVSIDPNTYPFFACLKEDRELWVTILNEMAGGHDLAHSRKDPKIIYQAANNVTLANVLVQMDISVRIASEVCYFARKRNTDRAELSDETREVLERRIDPNIKEPNRTTVTCVTYVPGNTLTGLAPTVWCGLGSGTIIVYEVIGWTCLSELRYAKHRISCLVPVGESMVWAGSFDSVIYVINTDTRKAEQQLQNHTDFVSDIVCVEATPSQDVTWSASFCGQIIRWNPETREIQHEISLQKYTKTLSKLMIVGDCIWCGSSDSLLVVNAKSGELIKKLRRTDDIGIPIPMECFGLVEDVEERKIWGFGRQKGELFVWSTTSYDCKQVALGNDVKASSVLPIGNKAWIGCKDGKVFVLGHSDYVRDRELNAHTDKVTCICLTDEGHVITGSSSKEGKLCVWNTMVRDRYDAAVSLGFDVLDGGLRVKSKIRSRRPSQAE